MSTDAVVGFLHPGKMGGAMATVGRGHAVWAGNGRSPATATRAQASTMRDVGTVAAMAEQAEIIISICPPDAAVAVADEVAAAGFNGLFVDANAIAPATAISIASRFERFVDGSVVGPPPSAAMSSRLYLSGPEAGLVEALFVDTALEPRVISDEPGRASALKMGYAGFTKGLRALVLDVAAFADAQGVGDALWHEFSESQPTFEKLTAGAARGAVPKAWRFGGEMQEIAAAYAAVSLPNGFWTAAAEVYAALGGFKNAEPPPSVDDVVQALRSA